MNSSQRIYLDYAASAPVTARAQSAFTEALALFGNPSSPHEEGQRAAKKLLDARTKIAHLAGVKPRHVIFTSGATEANALAIKGFVKKKQFSNAKLTEHPKPLHILYLPTAHASTVHTVEHLQHEGVLLEILPINDGKIDLQKLAGAINQNTALVLVDAICGETGTRFDLRGLRKTLDVAQKRLAISHIQMHVDASQLPCVESFDRLRLAADTVTLDAQKVGGVRGIGALIVGTLSSLAPIMHGGGQEEGLRPGTEPVALAAAFAEALEEAAEKREEFVDRSITMRNTLIDSVRVAPVPGIAYDTKHQAPHILNVSYPGIDTDYLVAMLDAKGFAVSTKSACETDSDGSRAIMILTSDEPRAMSTLRISWGSNTSEENVKSFSRALHESLELLHTQQKAFGISTRA